MELDLEQAVTQFLTIAESCQSRQLTAVEVISEIVNFYRDVRISGTDVADEGDMLLFQWGAMKLIVVSHPTDLRGLGDKHIQFSPNELKYLDFTRQIFVDESGDADFDSTAIQMSLSLVYGPGDGSEVSGSMWISSLTEIEDKVKEHALHPSVIPFLNDQPSQYFATAFICG